MACIGAPVESTRKSTSEPRPTFPCRECKAPVSATAASCASCGCKAPFACTECGKAISAVTLGVKRSHKYPHGAYTPEGQPLCADHRITRCHRCSDLFPLHVTKRKSIGERADTNLRRGMKPRMEKIYGSFCPACYGEAVYSACSTHRTRDATPNYTLFLVLLLLFVLALVGVGVLMVVAR